MMQRPQGIPVHLTTERFVLRSLTASDISDRWGGWSDDKEIVTPLNIAQRRMTKDDLRRYVARFDNENNYLIGVFTKAMTLHIGFFVIDVNRLHATASFNLVIGDKSYWGKGVVNEARAALLNEFFENRGIEKAYGTPLARNHPAVFNYKAQGWKLEGIQIGQCRSVIDGSRLDQYHFGMLRTTWRQRKEPAK
jgi:[ribosomal protein S5]-alanine N-acetyltransferase